MMLRSKTHNLSGASLRALLILPAIALGVLAMALGGVSPMLWGQQLAAFILFALLALPLRHAVRRVPASAWSVLLLLPLAAALWGPKAGGAQRWLDLAVFNVHAAMLVLPALLVVSCRVSHPCPILLAAAGLLCRQPDLSQLAALSAAMVPLLWRERRNLLWAAASAFLLAVMIIRCAMTPTSLEPVEYCEHILRMLYDLSPVLMLAGVASLVAVPAFFLLRSPRGGRTMLCLAVYYAVIILFNGTGQYPAPFLSLGLSPIVGYWLAYAFETAQKA